MNFRASFTALLALTLLPQARAGETVSKSDVLAAIQLAVESRGQAFPRGTCSQQLQMSATLPASAVHGLVVEEIRFDRGLGQARFLLRAKNDPKTPPFYAWCNYQSDAANQVVAAKTQTRATSPEISALGPALVDVRRPAQLYLHSTHSATVLVVKPLQSGHKDERIKVRLALTGKTIEARVVAQDALDATF